MPLDLLSAINSLPDRSYSAPGGGFPWDKEKDQALMAGWMKKPQKLVARVLGCGIKVARRRYLYLTGQGSK